MSLDLTSGSSLQQYSILLKASKGVAASGVVQQCLNNPNTFVFGEILDHENVKALETTGEKKWIEVLKIFAYGTYGDYQKQKNDLPALSPAATKKLRQLTIVSLADKSRVISYTELQSSLEVSNLRELEDLIIDSMYAGVISGKMDQEKGQLQIASAMGRDLKPEALKWMLETLSAWGNQAKTVDSTIEKKIQHAKLMEKNQKEQQQLFDQHRDIVKKQIQEFMATELQKEMFMAQEGKGMGGQRGPKGQRRGH